MSTSSCQCQYICSCAARKTERKMNSDRIIAGLEMQFRIVSPRLPQMQKDSIQIRIQQYKERMQEWVDGIRPHQPATISI